MTTNGGPPESDLADASKNIPVEAFGGRGADVSHVRRKVWAASQIIEGCWRWLKGDLDSAQRSNLIIAMEAFLEVLRRPSTTTRD